MRGLLAIVCLLLVVATTSYAGPCHNPFFHLMNGKDWAFSYKDFSAVQGNNDNVCPGFSGKDSCCDDNVFGALLTSWDKLFDEVVGAREKLVALTNDASVWQQKIEEAKALITSAPELNAQERIALLALLDYVVNQARALIPNALANFDGCYSSALRFLSGVLCKGCDPNWSDWVKMLNASDPQSDFEVWFAQHTCSTLQAACTPFFSPFIAFSLDIYNTASSLVTLISDNTTRELIIKELNTYHPPCSTQAECLDYICKNFLVGLDLLQDWIPNTFNNLPRKRDLQITRGTDSLKATVYSGTFDPFTQPANLKTDSASTNAASAVAPFWLELLL